MRKAFVISVVILMSFVFSVNGLQEEEEKEEHGDPSFDQEEAIKRLEKEIAGREKEPADKVFKNIQLLKQVPAERLLRIMQHGYSRSLGVNCTFCHNPMHWELDENKHKVIARGMMTMMRNLNENVLPSIKGLEDEKPMVNCTTCHRGDTKPALEMEEPAKTQ